MGCTSLQSLQANLSPLNEERGTEGQRSGAPRYGSVRPVVASSPSLGSLFSWGPATLLATSPRYESICRRARSVPRRWGALSRGNGRTPWAGTRPLRPLGATPRSAKLSLGSGRVSAAAGKEAHPGRLRVLCCLSRPAVARHLVAPSRTARGHAAAAGVPAPGLGGAGERERW